MLYESYLLEKILMNLLYNILIAHHQDDHFEPYYLKKLLKKFDLLRIRININDSSNKKYRIYRYRLYVA